MVMFQGPLFMLKEGIFASKIAEERVRERKECAHVNCAADKLIVELPTV